MMKIIQSILFTAVLATSLSVYADAEFTPISDIQDESLLGNDIRSRVGVQGFYVPRYSGSDSYEMVPFPLIDVSWRDTVFLNSLRGLGAQYQFRQFHVGAMVNYDWGRDEDDDHHLEGLGDVDGTFEGGVFAGYQLANWRLDAEILHAIGNKGYDGFEGKLALANIHKFFNDRVIVTASIQSSFADDHYMQAYYGVTSAQSVSSGLKQYTPSTGFYKAGGALAAAFGVTRYFSINGVIGYERLLDDAADSPVVQNGNQYRVGAGISYRF